MTYRAMQHSCVVSFVAASLLLASCGDSAATTTGEPEAAQPDTATEQEAQQTTPVQTQPQTETSETTPEVIPECEDPIEEVAIGATVTSEVVEGDPVYFCVKIPSGVEAFTVTLSGLTADLNLYVGYPDLAMVQEGGFGLMFSADRDTEDEVVTFDDVRPSSENWAWHPGSYYIEVSASGLKSSTFSLTVTSP